MEEHVDELYQEIVDILVDIVPENWRVIKLYAQADKNTEYVYFYYTPLKKGSQPVALEEICTKFKVNQQLHEQLVEELHVCMKQLWIELLQTNDDPWTEVTFSVTHEGEMAVDFGYEDLSGVDRETQRQAWFEAHFE